MFQEAGVVQFSSHWRLRIAVLEKKIPSFTAGKNRIYFDTKAVMEIIENTLSRNGAKTVDQALVRHYHESPAHNPFTALEKELAPTLAKAIAVYEEFNRARQNPLIVASEIERAKKTDSDSSIQNLTSLEPMCPTCTRTISAAREDHARINQTLVGRDILGLDEERMLTKFFNARCTECWNWLPQAPIALMHDKLHFSSSNGTNGTSAASAAKDVARNDEGATVSATPSTTDGVRTSSGALPDSLGASVEEAPASRR